MHQKNGEHTQSVLCFGGLVISDEWWGHYVGYTLPGGGERGKTTERSELNLITANELYML